MFILKNIKKILIILLLVIIKTIVFFTKSIYKFYIKNKPKMINIAQNFYNILKEEIS